MMTGAPQDITLLNNILISPLQGTYNTICITSAQNPVSIFGTLCDEENSLQEITTCTKDSDSETKSEETKGFWDKAKDFFTGIFEYPKTSYKVKEDGDTVKVIKTKKDSPFSYSTLTVEYQAYAGEEYDVNGELDKVIEQGQMEDCTLISMCYSMAQNPDGKKALKDAISINYDAKGETESYNVYFKGINETYTVTQEELDNAYNKTLEFFTDKSRYSYSRGDKDMLLLECAWSKCFSEFDKIKDVPYKSNIHPITSDYMPLGLSNTTPVQLFYALTGKEFIESYYNESAIDGYLEQAENNRQKTIEDYLQNHDEFKLADIMETVHDDTTFTSYDVNGDIIYEINAQDTYEIMRNTEGQNKEVEVKNLITNEVYSMNLKSFSSSVAGAKTESDLEYIFNFQYERAKNSDVRLFCTGHSFTVNDISGQEINISREHSYAVKSMDDTTITIVNPHNTDEEITISKEELQKHVSTGFNFNYGNIAFEN